VAALAVAIGLASGAVYAVAGDDPTGVSAPDVVGLKVSAARAEVAGQAREDGLRVPKVKVVDRSYSESVPAGAIVAQDPPDGKGIPENGALLVSVSKGSAYTDVPSVTGLEGAAAFALLERRGFTPTRRYRPSVEIEAWHAVAADPSSGTRVKRPARIELLVSTGPPKRPVPSLDGLDADTAADALRSAGFTPVVEERADTTVQPGTILGVTPSPGARTPLGSTVTIVVAREPRWEAISTTEGTEDAEQQVSLPAGARLVLSAVDTSPLGLWGGDVDVELDGDIEGSTDVDPGGAVVLADPSDGDRTIDVSVDVAGPAHWTLAVEVAR
jgi:serine/threonine-protein kinase